MFGPDSSTCLIHFPPSALAHSLPSNSLGERVSSIDVHSVPAKVHLRDNVIQGEEEAKSWRGRFVYKAYSRLLRLIKVRPFGIQQTLKLNKPILFAQRSCDAEP